VRLRAPVIFVSADEVMPAVERVPVEVKLRPCAVPETTTSVPVTVEDEEMVPVTFTAAEEVMPAAERVPVDVRLRPCAVPETTTSVPVTVDEEEMVPVTFTAADEVIPAADRVPVTSAGPPTTRLAVASMLLTDMVPPERRLLTVRLDVLMLDVLIVPVVL